MLVRAASPPGAFGRVFGIVTTGFNIGGTVGPLIGGWIMDHNLPRWVFFSSVLFMALTSVDGAGQRMAVAAAIGAGTFVGVFGMGLPEADAATQSVVRCLAGGIFGACAGRGLRLCPAAVSSGDPGVRHTPGRAAEPGGLGEHAVGQCVAEDRRFPFHHRGNPRAGFRRRQFGGRHRAMDQHRDSIRTGRAFDRPGRATIVFHKSGDGWLGRSFPSVIEPRRAADQPRQPPGQGSLTGRLRCANVLTALHVSRAPRHDMLSFQRPPPPALPVVDAELGFGSTRWDPAIELPDPGTTV